MSCLPNYLVSLAVIGSFASPTTVLAELPADPSPPLAVAFGDGSNRSVGTTIDDSVVTTKAKAALAGAEGVDAAEIDVDTRAGVVSLSGTVDSAAEVSLAESVVGDIEGVKAVDNRLKVKP